jgi:hypothetical protein
MCDECCMCSVLLGSLVMLLALYNVVICFHCVILILGSLVMLLALYNVVVCFYCVILIL